MKKLRAFALCFLLVLVAAAQEDPKFGLKGGLNVSTLHYSNGADADWRTGFNLGALAHVHFSPVFSLQPEIYYSSQGAKIPYGNSKLNLGLDYINVPVLLQYNFANGLRLQGGPQVGFLVGVSDKMDGAEQNVLKKTNFHTVDFSLPLGLSFLGYSGLGIDARYNIGLTNINNTDAVTIRNSVFQVGAFYLFDHRHKMESSKHKGKR